MSLGGNSNLNLHSQSRNSVHYTILKHESNEFSSLPIDPNLLTFNDSEVNSKFLEALYLDSEKFKISKEFAFNLLKFFIYLALTLTVLLFAVGKVYRDGGCSYNCFLVHVMCVSVIVAYSVVIIGLIIKKKYWQVNNRELICGIGCIFYLYMVLVNQKVLQGILGENSQNAGINFSLSIVGFMYFFRLALFDSFKHICFPVVFAIVISIFLNLRYSSNSSTEIISDFLLFGIILIMQLFESQQVSVRTTQLFFRNYNEELNNVIESEEEQKNGVELVSRSELILEKCEKVIKEIKNTRKAIIYNDIKIRLKKSISMLNEIKMYLGHYWHSETINFNDNSKIDSEDKEFITQNFLTASKLIPERPRGRQATLRDYIERKPHFSYSSSMLAEYVNILETLGKVWNFDSLALHQWTNRSISIIGKHLFHKWCLGDVLNISQETAYRLFEHLEIVIFI